MRLKIDLKTKIISSDTKVYLARAGKGGHLFQQVLEARAIGPDLPNLGLNLRNGIEGEQNLEAKVKRARALQRWIRTPAYRRGDQPSANVNDYHNTPKTTGHAQIEGIVKSYFADLQGGDVVVIPNPSYFGEAIIAEVKPMGPVATQIIGTRKYDGYSFEGRPFASFSLVKMSDLPRSVIDLAKAPTGLAQITNPAVKKRIFELGFSEFVLDDEFVSRIFTTKRDFTPIDANVLNAFVNMVAINVEKLENEGDEADLIGLVAAAFQQANNDNLQVKININSPGNLSMYDRSVVPLVTAVVLGVLVAVGFDPVALAQVVSLEVSNSAVSQALDLCSEPVSRLAESMLNFLPEDEFQASCDLLKATHEDTGASVDIEVEVLND